MQRGTDSICCSPQRQDLCIRLNIQTDTRSYRRNTSKNVKGCVSYVLPLVSGSTWYHCLWILSPENWSLPHSYSSFQLRAMWNTIHVFSQFIYFLFFLDLHHLQTWWAFLCFLFCWYIGPNRGKRSEVVTGNLARWNLISSVLWVWILAN